MSTVQSARATLEDLLRTEGKAELVGGRIVHFMSTGVRPSEVASNIYVSLREHAKKAKVGKAFNDNLGYAVPELPSGRESFSPDTSYYKSSLPKDLMGFVNGPPTFAGEVRSKNDYGDAAEIEMATKRADYFALGTPVVWDVDPISEVINCYRATSPNQAIRFHRGQIADAEPAVPGWRIAVDEVFV
jgi:Uma2 family endonuclease